MCIFVSTNGDELSWRVLIVKYKQVSHCLITCAINKLVGKLVNGNVITNEVGSYSDVLNVLAKSQTSATLVEELETV